MKTRTRKSISLQTLLVIRIPFNMPIQDAADQCRSLMKSNPQFKARIIATGTGRPVYDILRSEKIPVSPLMELAGNKSVFDA